MEVDTITAGPDTKAELQRFKRGMSVTHELMGEWILQNPGGTLRDMSGFFGYSASWLCTIINSDMFKAYMHQRMAGVQAVVTQDVPQKMAALAHVACDRMMEVLQSSSDPELLKDSFDKVMHRYGYAPNARNGMNPQGLAIGQQNNVFFLNRDDLAAVREKLVNSHAVKPSTGQEDGEQYPVPYVKEV